MSRKRTPTLPGMSQDDPAGIPDPDRELILQIVKESEDRTQGQIDDLKVGLGTLHQRFDEHLERSSRAALEQTTMADGRWPRVDSSRVPPPKGSVEAKILGSRIRGSSIAVITILFFVLAILVMVYILKS